MLGIYEVTAILPNADNQSQYRLKSIGGRLKRAVRESEILSMPQMASSEGKI
jgi:hypothetical protein